MPERHRILIVDDNAEDRQAVILALQREAAEIDGVEADVLELDTIAGAHEALRREEFSCVFLNHDLPDGTSLDLLMRVRAQGLITPVVVLTGQRDVQTIVELMEAGVVDYLLREKLHPDLVARSLRAALLFRQAQREKQRILDKRRARDRAIAAAPNGIVIGDPRQPDCPIVYANEAFLQMTGYTEAEVLGRNCRFLQGTDTDPAAVWELREAVRDERPCQVLLLNNRKDGTAFWNELTVSPVRDARGVLTHFVGVQTDVTAQQEADTQRTRVEDELRQFQYLSESANDALFLLDEQGRFLYVNPAACRSLGYSAEEIGRMRAVDIDPFHEDAAYQTLFQEAKGKILSPFESLHLRRDGTAFPIEASVSSLDIGGQPLLFASVRDISERKAAEAQACLRAARERFLGNLAERTRGITDPEEVIADAVRSVGEFLGVSRCLFADIDIEADTCSVPPHYCADDSVASIAGVFPISAFGPFVVAEYKAGRTAVVDDVRADRVKAPPESLAAYEAIGVGAYVAVPVLHSARLVSALAVHSAAPRHWTPEEITLLQTVVERTWLTVEVTRQNRVLVRVAEEQRVRAEREALLGRIGVALRSTLDPELIQQRAATLLGEALSADRSFYVTYDLARNRAQVSQDWHREDLPSLAGGYSPLDFGSLLGELFPMARTAVVDDVRAAFSPALASAFEASDQRAVLAVPFFDGESLVAALFVSQADAPRAWTTEDTALAEQVATLTRTALEAARVQAREHAIAEQLQHALQPALPEYVRGLSIGRFTKPALDEAQIGGDFYDIFSLDKQLYAIVIGDVSGKGLAAAQQLALIRNSLRTVLYLYRSPAQAAAAVNAIVTAHDLLVGFVTAWVGVYDAVTGQITYCSCGHEPGLVRRAGGALEGLESTGSPLGVAENATYSETSVALFSGDHLLLYTDGISEAGPSRREMLGTEGLMRLFGTLPGGLGAQSEAEALVSHVSAYTNGIFRDDVAVLLLRRE